MLQLIKKTSKKGETYFVLQNSIYDKSTKSYSNQFLCYVDSSVITNTQNCICTLKISYRDFSNYKGGEK